MFSAIGVAIFVNGCYWHRCPACALPQPRANAEFWREKFDRNVERDQAAEAALVDAGWTVQIVWEHELRTDMQGAARHVAALIALKRGEK